MAVTSTTQGASTPRSARPHLFWSRLHFLIRLLGLTGALVGCVGGFLAAIEGELQPPLNVAAAAWESYTAGWNAAGTVGEKLNETSGYLSQVWAIAVNLTRTALDQPRERLALVLLLAGAAAALFALLIEVLVILCFSATHRSAFGVNAVLQGALALVLLIGVNVWSFRHYQRLDFTRAQEFTLPAEVRNELARLDPHSQTTVLVYQRHKAFGMLSDKPPDDYDSAAERKVVEKIKDLVEQLREVGPRIQVEVLDVQAKDYKQRFDDITDQAIRGPRGAVEKPVDEKRRRQLDEQIASLRKAIDSAPENSIFFCSAGDKDKPLIQHLNFSDFYLLDKKASQQDRGNLVLLYQGIEPFAHRLLHLDERKPRIAIATIHEVLSTDDQEEIGLHGLRTALETRGFEVTDIVLKKWPGAQPAVYSLDESALDRLENREKLYQRNLDKIQQARGESAQEFDFWKKAPQDEKTRTSLLRQIREQAAKTAEELDQEVLRLEVAIRQYRQALARAEGDAAKARIQKFVSVLEENHNQMVESRDLWKKAIDDERAREKLFRQVIEEKSADVESDLQRLDQAIKDYKQRLETAQDEKSKLNVHAIDEQRHLSESDLKAKFQRLLSDCDLLIVPRMTLRNTATLNANIPPQYYPLDAVQVEAIQEFLTRGKPVLACLGPISWPADLGNFSETKPDGVEELLAKLGVHLNRQTILFDAEVEGFAENRAGLAIAGAGVEVPPLIWDWKSGDGLPPGSSRLSLPPNRISRSMQLTARGLGNDQALDIRIRAPRPVYYVPPGGDLARRAVQTVVPLVEPSWTTSVLSLAALERAQEIAARQWRADPVCLMTNPRSWNEDDPFPSERRIPQFEQLDSNEGGKDKRRQIKAEAGGLESRRRGPFPIGVAVETTVPEDWYDSSGRRAETVRLAVIGQGGFFTGKELPPAQEKLMVHTLDWLLDRDDRLPRDVQVWSYPRVDATLPPDSATEKLWLWGTRLGLPVLFAYLGLVVLLMRRLR
ncbi:MAG: hypothetical protein ACYC3I_23775 [Gemmataceae bacterium]